MILTQFNQIRMETDPSVIATLQRKGWAEVEQPEFNPQTQRLEFLDGKLIVADMEESVIKKSKRETLIESGLKIEPEGFILALKDEDRAAFSQMLSLVKEALDLGLITNETPQIIADKNGQKHQISTLRFRQIMVQYGLYYKSLWDQST